MKSLGISESSASFYPWTLIICVHNVWINLNVLSVAIYWTIPSSFRHFWWENIKIHSLSSEPLSWTRNLVPSGCNEMDSGKSKPVRFRRTAGAFNVRFLHLRTLLERVPIPGNSNYHECSLLPGQSLLSHAWVPVCRTVTVNFMRDTTSTDLAASFALSFGCLHCIADPWIISGLSKFGG